MGRQLAVQYRSGLRYRAERAEVVSCQGPEGPSEKAMNEWQMVCPQGNAWPDESFATFTPEAAKSNGGAKG